MYCLNTWKQERIHCQQVNEDMKRVVSSTQKKEGIWRCDPCRWYYYPELGDPTQNIPPGTAFEDLPRTWRCPICKEPKSAFTFIR